MKNIKPSRWAYFVFSTNNYNIEKYKYDIHDGNWKNYKTIKKVIVFSLLLKEEVGKYTANRFFSLYYQQHVPARHVKNQT